MPQRWIFFFLLLICSFNIFSLESAPESKATEEITAALQKWSKDFNAKNTEGVCGLFAPDLIASYPGTADRNYDEMCQSLTRALTDPDKQFRYEAPEIQQIIVEKDLAVVRLIWTSRMSDKSRSETTTIKEKGLDVFKRQGDGSWKIVISYAYPQSEKTQAIKIPSSY